MYQIYPKLRELCENRGFSLHFIDLRWGVSKENAAENLAAQVCFDEIARCQELSPELNFLIFAGDRYGWQPLPVRIAAKNWAALTENIPDESDLWKILNSYYRQDLNDQNKDYILLSQGDIQTSVASCVSDDAVREFLWSQAEKTLGKDDAENFVASATEQEIIRGFFHAEDESRRNTFILLKQDKTSVSQESAEQRFRARMLKENLRRVGCGSEKHQICEYENGNTSWVSEVRDFLKDIITDQINRYEKMTDYQCSRKILENAFRVISNNYVELPQYKKAVSFIRAHKGQCVLLKGESGTGKSWFLRHYAMELERDGQCVASVFNDIQSEGRNLLMALEQIVESLCQSGLIAKEKVSRPTYFAPVEWFEAQLRKVLADKPVTIILDTINEKTMAGYKQINGKSFFRMHLPSCVTLLISAVSDEDLRQEDKKDRFDSFEFHTLCGEDSMRLLSDLIKKRGRLLQAGQKEKAGQLFQDNYPHMSDPLTVELIAQYFQNIHSWQPVSLEGKMDFSEVVKVVLFGSERDDYAVLRSHTLGFLALSTIGLSETEIQDLLYNDKAVVNEIRRQTEWKFEGAIPNVLWALQYAKLKPFLTEINDYGLYLLRLRHTRLQDEIIKALPEEERNELLAIMGEYYGGQEWILQTDDITITNRRKTQELFPIYEKLHEVSSISRCITDPLCVDAFVRCGMRMEIKDYLSVYASDAVTICMLENLQCKDYLFRQWPDSFLPSVFSDLITSENDKRRQEKLVLALHTSGHEYYIETSYISQGGYFFPQLHGRCHFALNANGFVAVHMDKKIQIIDMRHMEFMKTCCSAVKEQGFLYWQGDVLFLRCHKKRILYSFHENQLVEIGCQDCPDWADLLDERKIWKAGGWVEADRIGQWTYSNTHLRYYDGHEVKHCDLFYHAETSIWTRVHGSLAAIVLDGRKLEIVNLDTQSVISRSVYENISHVEWAENGKELLVVLRGNILLVISVDAQRAIASMPMPETTYLQYKMKNEIASGINDIGATIHRLFEHNKNIYTGDSDHLPGQPLLGALSVKYGWAAYYFRTDTESCVRVYSLTDFKRKYTIITDPVMSEDIKGMPFYPAEDRNGLILISNGKPVLYDLERQKHVRVFKSSLIGDLKHDCFCDSPVTWHIDKSTGVICVFDKREKKLAADMTGGKILAADYDCKEHKLYLLMETKQIVIMKMVNS